MKGMPDACKEAIQRAGTLVETAARTEIAAGVLVTGSIPRRTEFEDTGGAFFLDEACAHPDLLQDDQALLIETVSGWVVITGCGHSGAVNTLNYAAELTGARSIYGFLGGMHLLDASEQRIGATARAFRERDLRLLVPCHCTGFAATGIFQRELGAKVAALRAGTRLIISGA
jgi:7,8-dihydropterin-6-yl-methyl-4-(beta-D-ribofuranosyl)aminobenzene 5'-phosphate synthase